MAEIVLDNVTKRYADGTEAVREMNLEIADGEFIILVGPSGCGKSTALQMLAGLEDITDGEMRIDGVRVNEKSPKDRDIAMVFQSYALYPHMTVRRNMGFSLELAKVDKQTIRQKVERTAEILELTPHLDRKPANLSGGQRQRVAMGRAIVRDPKAFLMDEPLSNLDAKLRVQMRTQVARIQQRLGTTTVYVTHDQTEALTLGDRVAVMRGGVIQQVGPPQELYAHPANLFVAGFIGSPAMNFLPGQLDQATLHTPLGDLALPDGVQLALKSHDAPRDLIVGLRPEQFEDAAMAGEHRSHGVIVNTTVDVVESVGSDVFVYFTAGAKGQRAASEQLDELLADAGGGEGVASEDQVVARLDGASRAKEGERLDLWVDTSNLQVFDPASGRNLTR